LLAKPPRGRGLTTTSLLAHALDRVLAVSSREGSDHHPPACGVQVITKVIDGKVMEPYEDAIVEVPEAFVGSVVALFAQRRGEMVDMQPGGGMDISRVTFKIATRGLLGLKNSLLTATKGTAVMNTIFDRFGPIAQDIKMREQGSLCAFETGQATAYAIESAQDRGLMFIRPQEEVYQGQVVGMHNKAGDLPINVCKMKRLTNMRASGSDIKTVLDEPRTMSLDDALEYINDDEQVTRGGGQR
jgi:GTP-binding protein